MGLLNEAVASGEKALEICRCSEEDQYLYYRSLGGLGLTYYLMGYKSKVFEAGQTILEYSQRRGNIRGEVMGHHITGWAYSMDGDLSASIAQSRNAVELSADPFYKIFPKVWLARSYIENRDFQEAEQTLKEVLEFSCEFGVEIFEYFSRALLLFIAFLRGDVNAISAAEDVLYRMMEVGMKGLCVQLFRVIASSLMLQSGMVADAQRKARNYFYRTIETAGEIGAKGCLGMAYLGLGRLSSVEGNKDKARQYTAQAVLLFEQCELDTYLRQAKEVLDSLQC